MSLEDIQNFFSDNSGLFGLGGAGLGAALAYQGYENLGDIGGQAYRELAGPDGLAQQLTDMTEFRPFGVTTATGSQFGMQVDPTTGQLSSTLPTVFAKP